MLLFGGTLIKSQYGSLLFVSVCFGGLYLLQIIPKVSDYNPLRLMNNNMNLLTGKVHASEFVVPVFVCIVLAVALLVGTIFVFNKKDIN